MEINKNLQNLSLENTPPQSQQKLEQPPLQLVMQDGSTLRNYTENDREFLPRCIFPDGACSDPDPEDISIYDPQRGVTHIMGLSNLYLITTDGSCASNGLLASRGSCGVFFGPESPYNIALMLPVEEKQTNNVAELYAVRLALLFMLTCPGTFRADLIILTDSTYVSTSLSEYIRKWKLNGWRRAGNEPVENLKLMMELDGLIDRLRVEKNKIVRFWRKDRMFVVGADQLARSKRIQGQ